MIYPTENKHDADTQIQPVTVRHVGMTSNRPTPRPVVPIKRLGIMMQQHSKTKWVASQLIVTSPPDGVGR